jgi:hypothetical protein
VRRISYLPGRELLNNPMAVADSTEISQRSGTTVELTIITLYREVIARICRVETHHNEPHEMMARLTGAVQGWEYMIR